MTPAQKDDRLAQVLRSLREHNHYYQIDIATGINVSRQTYGNYESGKRTPDTDTLRRLAAFYAMPYSELLEMIYPNYPGHAALQDSPPSMAEQYAREYRTRIRNPKKFWDELFSPENTRLVFYYTKVEPSGQREISEFIQRNAEGFC